MKFLPRKYRETQADWFAKRGMSWHISVVMRKDNGKLQQQTLVHIVENNNQESETVVEIVKHCLKKIKKDHPEITTAYMRQDNAGCYHSSMMLIACRSMKEETGITIERVDFSDPQGGKGPCDRKAATIKAHVRHYVNEGHDVLTHSDFKDAMLSFGGVRGVRVALFNSAESSQQLSSDSTDKLEGVSTLNNFSYDGTDTIKAWKAYGVGEGKPFTLSKPKG